MLYELLSEYHKNGAVPLHMPGHKRNTKLLGDKLPYSLDITEITGFDNLQDMTGVLKDTADTAAALYGTDEALLLVNGATGGILAAVRAAVRAGDTVIMARNCHQSVYNALDLNDISPVFLLPETDGATGLFGSIRPEQVEKALQQNPSASLVIVTSPTYEGVVSDLPAIVETAHRHFVPVLVDAAHGAHLGFHEAFPDNAVAAGADLVVMSLHKTLPALTQCALLCRTGTRVDTQRLRRALAVFQTSSPSYVLLSSIDFSIRETAAQRQALFEAYAANLRAFDAAVKDLKKLAVVCHGRDALSAHPAFFAFDPGKIVVSTRETALTGPALFAILRDKYRIELEMAYPGGVLAMTSVCDSHETFETFARALLEIDGELKTEQAPIADIAAFTLPERVLSTREAEDKTGANIPLEAAAGTVCLEYVWAYPPGVPILAPGEKIRIDAVRRLQYLLKSGVSIKSTRGGAPERLCCLEIPSTCL
ncbi:aminotransferase class I/II-fold pyridoxal phosphate-dependent enzyme [Oscillospiraceae bacterium WX1]